MARHAAWHAAQSLSALLLVRNKFVTPASLSESFVEIFTLWQKASEDDSSTKVRLINSPKRK